MTEPQILEFADRFMTAIERGDADGVRACYAPGAKVWHNFDDVEQTVDEAVATVAWLGRRLPDQKIRVVRREALKDGFLQLDVLEATLPNGAPFRMSACVIVTMKDGLIVRLDEYLDSAQLAPLRALR